MASCFEPDAVPNTSAPRDLAIWVAEMPTPPAAAWISARSPSLSPPMITSPAYAVE